MLANQILRLLSSNRLFLFVLLVGLNHLFGPVSMAQGQTFNQIEFVIGTGGDDLRGDSSATATLQAPNGAMLQVINLKTQNQSGWNNNTSHTVTVGLNPPRAASAIGHIVITLTSHNGFGESDDNWNVESVVVNLSNNGAGQIQLLSNSGDPLKRLTKNDPSLELTPPPPAPPGTFDQIQFVIGTGDDDLRGDSSATATLQNAGKATLQVITLKTQNQPGWNNNTSHTVTAQLSPPQLPSAISHIVITLTSHNGFGESDDNWNVQTVTVSLLNNGAGQKELMSFAGAPLKRLTGSDPSLTLPEENVGAAGTFNQIEFVIGTGGDDLRGDSSATVTLESPNGTFLQTVTLKDKDKGSWDNNSTHTVSAGLNPPRTPCAIGHIFITLTSHNGLGETNDNWNVQNVNVTLSNNGVSPNEFVNGSGNPLARLTGDLPTLVLEGPDCIAKALGPQPGTGRLKGFVDLHTHPLANVAFGGKLLYGGVDVGSLLPADPDCHHDVRAANSGQALGHDGSTHGPSSGADAGLGAGAGAAGGTVVAGPIGTVVGGIIGGIAGGSTGTSCGDTLRSQIIPTVQTSNGAANPSSDSRGAPDFKDWPVWNDITHQKMWVDWIRRSYDGGLRVLVALATNNKTIGDGTAGPGDGPTDDKASADLQLAEIKSFVSRHPDFMEVALTSADLERIVRANKLAIVLGVEIDNIGNFNKVSSLTNAEISAEIQRLFNEGVRYIFPIHLLDNRFGGTATYVDLFNYSTFREDGHWWSLECKDPSINYTFTGQGFDLLTFAGEAAKLGIDFAASTPPNYPSCGQRNSMGLTGLGPSATLGQFAVKEMMRHGMLIDIDHMSELSQDATIAIAQGVGDGAGYPLNSGHSGLRGFLPVPPGTFNQIQFVIETGGDDLRGDSSATATLQSTTGATLQTFTLKAQNQPSWNNNTSHTVTFPLNPPIPAPTIGHLLITLTSHNSLTETNDNWNIETLTVILSNNGGGPNVIVSGVGDPMVRLTGSVPTLTLPATSERSMDIARYAKIGKLHGMAGVGSANLNSFQWVEMYQKIIEVMGNGAVAGFGTDTNGLALGMPPRTGSAVPYSDSSPKSSLGTKFWNYNSDGVAHYGMLSDFLEDARTAPGGAALVDNNVMFGADYFLQTWKKCEAEKTNVQ